MYNMLKISVIIPTRNRSKYLIDAVKSVLDQSLDQSAYEILIVDNGSEDDTRATAERLEKRNPRRLRYIYENKPGLHHGRHRGIWEAGAEILVFIDDDIIAAPRWLEMITDTFGSNDVALVGGKVLPRWEGEVPQWLNSFKKENEFGWTIGYLSLLDFGNTPREIPGKFVFGCNFSIRKSVLVECGGFHPDGMPEELIQYRGDGETALSKSVQAHGYKIIYQPRALIYHRIPPERLTVDYFCRRAFNQGISKSFTEIRHEYGLNLMPAFASVSQRSPATRAKELFSRFFSRKRPFRNPYRAIRQQIAKSHEAGKSYHKSQVADDPKILEYVLQKTYF